MEYLINILPIASTSAFIVGILMQRKEKYYIQMFNDILDCPEFELSYVNSLDDLPQKKLICLCAETEKTDKIKESKLNPHKFAILSSIIAQTDKNNVFFKGSENLSRENSILTSNFWISNFQQYHRILVQFPLDNIRFYNIHSFPQEFEPLNGQMKIDQFVKKCMGTQVIYKERAILAEESYIFIGNLEKQANQYNFKAKLIAGESRDVFLKFLDDYLVNMRKKSSRLIMGAGITIFIPVFLRMLYPKPIVRRKKDL